MRKPVRLILDISIPSDTIEESNYPEENAADQQLAPLHPPIPNHISTEVMQNSYNQQRSRSGSTAGFPNNNTTSQALVSHSQHPNELVLSRRPSAVLSEILSTRRPSAIMAALTRPNHYRSRAPQMDALYEGQAMGSMRTINMGHHNGPHSPEAMDFKRKNRRVGE